MQDKNNLPLFPIGLVLLPGMVIPLHLFEERYKNMANRCLEKSEPFGIVYYSGNKMNELGCTAEIIEVIKKYPDGRMDILIEGKERFKINNTNSDELCLQADISFFDDEYETTGENLEASKKEAVILLKEIMKFYGSGGEDIDFIDFDPKIVSFLVTSNSSFTMDEKQSFLEMINTRERLEKAVKALKIIVERVKVAVSIEQIIQSNGYLPKKHD